MTNVVHRIWKCTDAARELPLSFWTASPVNVPSTNPRHLCPPLCGFAWSCTLYIIYESGADKTWQRQTQLGLSHDIVWPVGHFLSKHILPIKWAFKMKNCFLPIFWGLVDGVRSKFPCQNRKPSLRACCHEAAQPGDKNFQVQARRLSTL